jgi:hypothetical protein
MSGEAEELMEMSTDVAIASWYAARRQFQSEPGSEHLNDYNLASDLLAQAFKRDYAEGTEAQAAFEAFRRVLIEQEED